MIYRKHLIPRNSRTFRIKHFCEFLESRQTFVDSPKAFDFPKNLNSPKKSIFFSVGSEDGTFRLINLKKDEILLKLNHAKPITALDCQTERPIVACGLSDGSVSVWDLEEMSLITQISAHTSSVNSLTYLPQEDSFVSIGSDNAIKVYVENKVFDFFR